MILYFAPGACSLADHIALHEANIRFDRVKVDLKTHRTQDGRDFTSINPKGYVPALVFDDGQILTENVAVLSWIADQAPALGPGGPLGRFRLLEALGYISAELHKAFKPFFMPGATDANKAAAGKTIVAHLDFLAGTMKGDYLFGPAFSVADAYLFVMLTWARKNGLAIGEKLDGYADRVGAREAVRSALKHEEEG